MGNDPKKQQLLKEFEDKERKKLVDSIPVAHDELRMLFERLDTESNCDHTFRVTTKFLEERNLPIQPVLTWLREYGGYCDCEVMYNVEDKFGEIVGFKPPDEG